MSAPALLYEKRDGIAYIETVLRTLSVSPEEGFQVENENARVVLATEDAREGPRAFIEKRKPRYVGR